MYWAVVNISLLFIFIDIAFSAWTISVLWGWFSVSIFRLLALNIFAVIGLKTIFTLLKQDWRNDKNVKNGSDYLEYFFFVLGVNLTALGTGWLAHFWNLVSVFNSSYFLESPAANNALVFKSNMQVSCFGMKPANFNDGAFY